MIKKGYTRIQEKLKEIRQNFSKAVTAGSRSGSGKIVLEFYDQLVKIWGGSAATKPLSFGINTDEVNNNTNPDQAVVPSSSSSDEDSVAGLPSIGKRKRTENPVPKLIDNKRKHLERQLSASQRDQILINESKEDSEFKKNIAEAIRQSNETFGQCLQQMSMSIQQVAQGLTRSVEIMSQAMMGQTTTYQYPNGATIRHPTVPGYVNEVQYHNSPVVASSYIQPARTHCNVNDTSPVSSNRSMANIQHLETIDSSSISQWET